MGIPSEQLSITCLVVDDEIAMRKTMKNILTTLGFKNILVAENGRVAINFIQNTKVDLVIADINMPEMNGFELLKAVRDNRKFDEIRFIFVTAEARKDAVARVAEGGAEEYIIKPFILKIVEDKVSKVLDKRFNPTPLQVAYRNFTIFFDSRDFRKAEEQLAIAAEILPDSAAILFSQAKLSYAMGKTEEAIELYKMAIEKKPLFVKAYDAIGEIYEDMGSVESAINYYELAKNISPANTERLIKLSKLVASTGDVKKSQSILKEALVDVREDISTSGLLLGEIYLTQNNPEKAFEILTKAHAKNPSDVSLKQSLAEACRKTGKFEEALRLYLEILKINSDSTHIHYLMSKTYLEMGNKKMAIDSMKKAWELNPFSKEITQDLKALSEQEKFSI